MISSSHTTTKRAWSSRCLHRNVRFLDVNNRCPQLRMEGGTCRQAIWLACSVVDRRMECLAWSLPQMAAPRMARPHRPVVMAAAVDFNHQVRHHLCNLSSHHRYHWCRWPVSSWLDKIQSNSLFNSFIIFTRYTLYWNISPMRPILSPSAIKRRWKRRCKQLVYKHHTQDSTNHHYNGNIWMDNKDHSIQYVYHTIPYRTIKIIMIMKMPLSTSSSSSSSSSITFSWLSIDCKLTIDY
mgnify:CR=1 FL=1